MSAPAPAPAPAAEAPDDVVMYCSQACQRSLPANGFKACPMCGQQGPGHFCNRRWKVCEACSKEHHLCVVCGNPNWESTHKTA